ncbi:hypothetical protein EJ04DRAFT_568645 [Polyplosphaeria fusca]|uniref:Uncharacterized protein n=1 Tax=Polyplosphaeria fusca TaxID=682080 RepID=A0A9P4UUZ6_9PLEO|nr:hypothetical protein EJ04DRAFT_568645 [Polyplosphaeria fusca]
MPTVQIIPTREFVHVVFRIVAVTLSTTTLSLLIYCSTTLHTPFYAGYVAVACAGAVDALQVALSGYTARMLREVLIGLDIWTLLLCLYGAISSRPGNWDGSTANPVAVFDAIIRGLLATNWQV